MIVLDLSVILKVRVASKLEMKTKSNLSLILFSFQNPLLLPIITPRFAVSCSGHLMSSLGDVANLYDLPIQVQCCYINFES